MSAKDQATQIDLFDHLLDAYAKAPDSLSNAALYRNIGERAGIDEAAWAERQPIGRAAQAHSPLKRRVRWQQQTLRALGLLERDEAAGRGHWRLTAQGKRRLTPAAPQRVLLGFRTDLGLALWGSAESVYARLDEPVALCLTSPPYAIQRARAYGGPDASIYVDWICRLLEPIVRHLMPGGTIALNVTNDAFEPGSPARSLIRERLVIALCDRLNLVKIDELVWHCPNKAPAPLQWASRTRQQLNTAYEPVYLFTNDAKLFRGDNRRVLQQHTDRQLKLIRQGGEKRQAVYGDGAYRLREGSFGAPTAGRIPRNVLTMGHQCPDKNRLRAQALAQGLPTHGAAMPLRLAQFLVEYLTEPDDMVVDACSGWFTTAKAAEVTGRRWIGTELMGEYVLGAANRFKDAPGFESFGALAGWPA